MSRDKIIKQGSVQSGASITRGIIKRPIVDAKATGRRIVAEAEAQAAALRESAQAFARELRESAYQEGHEAALLELNQHLLDACERRDTALLEVEQDMLRLAVKIAEKIIGRELEHNDSTLASIVATALRHARQHEVLVVRINPADIPTVLAHRDQLDPMGRARFLDIIPDPRVGHGGCIIEGPSGTVDAQLATQLRVLERALLTRTPGEGRTRTASDFATKHSVRKDRADPE